MIGRGGVFAALRTRMLQGFPSGTKCKFNGDATIGDWLETGSFLVLASTKRSITLQANLLDFAGVKLNEIENLLNHALEHIRELIYYYRSPVHRSESWVAVTAYYLGFFSATTILRLVGMPIVFLSTDRLRVLRGMVGTGPFPSPGSFKITVGQPFSATSVEVNLTSVEKIHEATWKTALGLFETLRNDATVVFTANEANFYDSLCSKLFSGHGIGLDWPSDVRNKANYRPGFSYRLSRPVFHMNRFLEQWRAADGQDVFNLFNNAFRHCSADRHSFAHQVEMMAHVSVVLYLIARSLYSELESRSLTDRRWETQRSAYKSRAGLAGQDFEQICA